MDRFSQDCSGREDIEEIKVDLSSTLSRALCQIPDIGSNTKGGFEAIGMYIDKWRDTISTTISNQAEKSARDQAVIASTNEEMISMKASLADIQTKIQANEKQGNKNADHINILNNKILFVKQNIDRIAFEVSEKVNQFEA